MKWEEQECLDEKYGKHFVDIVKILPEELDKGRKIIITELKNDKIEVYIKKRPGKAGHDSKKVVLSRFIELDDLFFEGLGLWQGEGGKDKGLYFGNTCIEVLLHFLKFVEEKLRVSRKEFKITLNVPELNRLEDEIKKVWSEKLRIPFENFTNVCVDSRINEEYAQMYFNSIALSNLMKALLENSKPRILSNPRFTVPFLRGFLAGEAAVVLKEWGTVAHVAVANKDMKVIDFVTSCLECLKIARGKYFEDSTKFPIYGKQNFDRVEELELLKLNPEKQRKFDEGMSKFQRFIQKSEEMEVLILQQLNPKPKTYDELANGLNKGRSTIQSHYIPLLEKKEFVKKIGKRKQAWLFALTDKGKKFLEN